MELAADSMTHIFSDDAETVGLDEALDCVSDISDAVSRHSLSDAHIQALLGRVKKVPHRFRRSRNALHLAAIWVTLPAMSQ